MLWHRLLAALRIYWAERGGRSASPFEAQLEHWPDSPLRDAAEQLGSGIGTKG